MNPSILTLEDFCAFYEKGQKERDYLFNHVLFGIKERQRYRDKDRRSREKAKIAKAALPPEQRKKIGRPRKDPNSPPSSPSVDS